MTVELLCMDGAVFSICLDIHLIQTISDCLGCSKTDFKRNMSLESNISRKKGRMLFNCNRKTNKECDMSLGND